MGIASEPVLVGVKKELTLFEPYNMCCYPLVQAEIVESLNVKSPLKQLTFSQI